MKLTDFKPVPLISSHIEPWRESNHDERFAGGNSLVVAGLDAQGDKAMDVDKGGFWLWRLVGMCVGSQL